MTRGGFAFGLLGILIVAALLRGLFPTADPPWETTVGIVWHDEGAWVHNARNRALFGSWSLDALNAMYVAPVFTGLEYLAFEAFGVGLVQARLVPALLGVLSVLLLALGVARVAGRAAGLAAGALLATNYVYVHWNRTAMMEGPMAAFVVGSWYCYVRAQQQPLWGWLAGVGALLAFFTKAAAAFFIAALGLEALLALALAWRGGARDALEGRAAVHTLAGLAGGSVAALAAFVAPNWTEYRFYNWQMSVTRKPSYTLRALVDRVTWFPILHDVFTRSWAIVAVGTAAALGALGRWRGVHPGTRLLLLWIGIGTLELLVHDVGNERRFVFLIPAFAALAAIALGGGALLPAESAAAPRRRALLALPIVLFAAYVVAGAVVRLAFLYEIRPNVRLAAAVAAAFTTLLYATWPRIPAWLARGRWSPAAGLGVALLVAAGHLVEYAQWAAGRTYENVQASREIGRVLPHGTLVHGKLANGLSLENGIRPVFVGRGFGNYEDRKRRDDVRYILTYIAPSLGWESQASNPVILDVLEAYPDRRIIMTFDVAETATGHDRAALIDKFGHAARAPLPGPGRAQD